MQLYLNIKKIIHNNSLNDKTSRKRIEKYAQDVLASQETLNDAVKGKNPPVSYQFKSPNPRILYFEGVHRTEPRQNEMDIVL